MIALQRLCVHYCLKFLRLILDVLSLLFGLLTPSQVKKLPHNSDPILFESCIELSNRIKKGEISCEEVIKAYWKRVQQVQPFINAVVDSCFSEAIAEARRVDTIVKQELSGASVTESVLSKPLLGVPFTCKNSIAVKNLAFDAGSLLLKGNRAVNDAPVIDNLRKSGAIPIA
ncbi:amidase-like protein, partial [Leptotrombidium deliense]